MTFNSAMFKMPGEGPGNQAAMDGAPASDPTRGIQRGGGGVFPDPDSVQAGPIRRAGLPPATGSMTPANAGHLRVNTGTCPGEPAARVVVPSLTKAGTSGSETPLAENRHATRPGQQRHPSNGQFLATENIAAGHPSLRQQPDDRNARRANPATTDLPSAPNQVTSRIQHSLARHMAGAQVQSMDLRGPSGMPQFAQPVQSPDQAGSIGQHLGQKPAAVVPDHGAADMPVPLMPQRAEAYPLPSTATQADAAFRGGMQERPAFGGVLPSAATCNAPGW